MTSIILVIGMICFWLAMFSDDLERSLPLHFATTTTLTTDIVTHSLRSQVQVFGVQRSTRMPFWLSFLNTGMNNGLAWRSAQGKPVHTSRLRQKIQRLPSIANQHWKNLSCISAHGVSGIVDPLFVIKTSKLGISQATIHRWPLRLTTLRQRNTGRPTNHHLSLGRLDTTSVLVAHRPAPTCSTTQHTETDSCGVQLQALIPKSDYNQRQTFLESMFSQNTRSLYSKRKVYIHWGLVGTIIIHGLCPACENSHHRKVSNQIQSHMVPEVAIGSQSKGDCWESVRNHLAEVFKNCPACAQYTPKPTLCTTISFLLMQMLSYTSRATWLLWKQPPDCL